MRPTIRTLCLAVLALCIACDAAEPPPRSDADRPESAVATDPTTPPPPVTQAPPEEPAAPETTPAPAPDQESPPIPADTVIQTTKSGLKYSVLKEGYPQGRTPGPYDKVHVHYQGWLPDGRLFDSSRRRGNPQEFEVHRVIAGWTEGLQLMKQGAIYKFTIPPGLAYGEKGSPAGQIPPNATLIFEVELLAVTPGTPPPPPLPTPDFVAPVESLMITTPSGLKYRVIKEGSGPTPRAGTFADVHYAGWLTDGTLLRTTFPAGKPNKELVGRNVVKGLSEGMLLMKEGSVYQFLVPPDLAFGERKMQTVPPNSTLVFHVEMIKVGAAAPTMPR